MERDAWKLITRGALEIIDEADLKKKLARGVPLNIKLGIDPTTPHVHLGFTVVMRKLRQFQDLGHRVILIVGDYTATVGDPSGKNKTRPILSHEEVLRNAETYKQQFFKIVDPGKTKVVYNGEWFSKLTFTQVTELMSQITVAQMLEREDFQNRYRNHQPISLHEFLYPMMQAYDSVMIDADVELGGMDQKFNVLRGRELQRGMGKEPQVGLFLPILLGTDGKEKMSKSLGNYIGISEPPQDMFHKLYALPDSLIESYFQLLTDIPLEAIQAKLEEMRSGKVNPNVLKDELARDIVTQYHGAEAADKAAAQERKIHAGEAVPENLPVVLAPAGEAWLPELIVAAGFAKSNGEARRLIENGGVSYGEAKVADPKAKVEVSEKARILKCGKRNFAEVRAGGTDDGKPRLSVP
jgi:tyrosyl-tRNA synthetase